MSTPVLLENSCSFWALTDEQRESIIANAEPRDQWDFTMKRRSDGYWEFDYPEFHTYNELLVGGTELIMDEVYCATTSVEPDEHSVMKVTLSGEPLPNQITVFTKLKDDPAFEGATYWQDKLTGMHAWICPWLRVCGLHASEKLYFSIEVIQ